MNISHLIVRPFDGENDGLVSVESARWGKTCKVITVRGTRGVSHGDMIDLNRENIDDFDVRELYIDIVSNLKTMAL
jgi:triacylglycerol lipase